MFTSPLPPGPDLPPVAASKTVGFHTPPGQPIHRLVEQNQQFSKRAEDDSGINATPGEYTGTTNYGGVAIPSVQPQHSESRDLNLTASLEAFVAGIQGHNTENLSLSVGRMLPEGETKEVLSNVQDTGLNASHSVTVGETREGRVAGTMEDYNRPAYMQSAVGSVFPEAYANSYILTKEGEPPTIPASASSYQVVLSDGTSYPSAIFPSGKQRFLLFFLQIEKQAFSLFFLFLI